MLKVNGRRDDDSIGLTVLCNNKNVLASCQQGKGTGQDQDNQDSVLDRRTNSWLFQRGLYKCGPLNLESSRRRSVETWNVPPARAWRKRVLRIDPTACVFNPVGLISRKTPFQKEYGVLENTRC